MAHRVLILMAGLACGGSPPATEDAVPALAELPDAPLATPELIKLAEDDLTEDPRPKLDVKGDVAWERGRLTLSEKSSVAWKLRGGAWGEFRLWLDPGELNEDGARSGTVVTILLEGTTPAMVGWIWSRQEGKTTGLLRVVAVRKNGAQVKPVLVREFSVPPGRAEWIVSYRYGLVRITRDGNDAGTAFLANGSAAIAGLRVDQPQGQAALRGWTFATSPAETFNADQQRQLAEARQLSQEAATLRRKGNYREAAAPAQRAVAIRKSVQGEKHPDYARSLNNLAELYSSQGEYAKAEPLYRQAMEIDKAVLGEKHPEYATSLNNLAELYSSQGKHAKAEPLYRQALEINKAVLGEKHPRYASSLNNLALFYQSQADFAKAEPLSRKALEIRKSVLGENHPDYAASLNNVSVLYRLRAEYAKAEPLLRQALEINRASLGEKHPDYAKSLNNLADLYRSQGEYAKAQSLLRQALELTKASLGEKHPDYATYLNNLAAVYEVQAEYAKAEPLLREALEINKASLRQKHPNYAKNLDNLADLYQSQAEYTKAEPLYRQALEINRASLGEKHPDYANSLINVAGLYRMRAEYANAESLYRQALAIRKAALGEKHRDYASGLNDLSALHFYNGEYAKAEPLLRQAMEIVKAAMGEEHPDYATTLNNLADVHKAQADYTRAELLYGHALEIRKAALGEMHPAYAASLNNLALSYFDRSESSTAEPLSREAAHIILAHLDRSAAAQTEMTQLSHGRRLRHNVASSLTCSTAARPPEDADYAVILAWKGATTSRQWWMRTIRSAHAAEIHEADRKAFGELESTSRQFAALSVAPTEGKSASDIGRRLNELAERREELEKQLAGRIDAFRTLRETRALTPALLRDALPPGTALVDFVVYRRKTPKEYKWTPHVVVFVVTKDAVHREELGPFEPIEKAIAPFVEGLSRRTRPVSGAEDPAVLLRDKLWLPVARHLDGAKIVLISPDGALCRLPFAALPTADGKRFLLEDVSLSVVPVPRLLKEMLGPRSTEKDDRPPSLLAVGDVDFDASSDAPAQPVAETAATPAWKRRRAGDAQSWPRLPGTRGEVLSLEDTFRKSVEGGKVTVLRDKTPTEDAVRQQVVTHDYLHLATHGFFAPPHVKSALAATGDAQRELLIQDDALPRFVGHHPGLLSGIVLAGANHPSVEGDDGVLTALEVSELDLRRVELAVLSACETGLGETAGGEGVLGLQRAFQVAGCRTTITSLWKVNDEATRQLMERFYENYWKKGMGTLESLREAQLLMLKEGVSRGVVRELKLKAGETPRTPPGYWAAFVLTGDWR